MCVRKAVLTLYKGNQRRGIEHAVLETESGCENPSTTEYFSVPIRKTFSFTGGRRTTQTDRYGLVPYVIKSQMSTKTRLF
ncbi:hypothetical protein LDENG_00181890 [Lucifuga dentata]|nr:hypothetical protein LDENG_00181890 [Lucifuga dentata]